jgi:glutathione S-transferase
MIDLYCMGWQDRSDRVRWLLEEMKIPYQNHFLKKAAGEMNTPEYRKINPMGRVPTIVDGDITMSESAAVCMYLADKYSYGILAPKMEDVKQRAEYTKWMVFSVGSLECVIARMFTHMRNPAEIKETEQYVSEQCEILKLVLNPILSKQDYILSSGFSAADIMLAAVIPGANDYLVENNPPLKKYMERLMNRDAAIKAKVF